MDIKIKKLSRGRIVRLEAENEIKDVFVKTDILNPENNKIEICFRGGNNSGVIELNSGEAEHLAESLLKVAKIKEKFKVVG